MRVGGCGLVGMVGLRWGLEGREWKGGRGEGRGRVSGKGGRTTGIISSWTMAGRGTRWR